MLGSAGTGKYFLMMRLWETLRRMDGYEPPAPEEMLRRLLLSDGKQEERKPEGPFRFEVKTFEARGLEQPSHMAEVIIPFGALRGRLRLQTFSGGVFYLDESLQVVLKDCSFVWLLTAQASDRFRLCDATARERHRQYEEEYFEKARTIAEDLGVGPEQVPWTVIFNAESLESLADDPFVHSFSPVKDHGLPWFGLNVHRDPGTFIRYLQESLFSLMDLESVDFDPS